MPDTGDFDRQNEPQGANLAWGDAFAALQLEARAMHRAHQQAILAAQELAGRPVEPTTRMRAHVEPGAHRAGIVAMQDQRLRVAVHHRLDFVQAAGRQRVQPGQRGRGGVVVVSI